MREVQCQQSKERFLNQEVSKISKKGPAFLPSPLILQKLRPPDCILDNVSLLCSKSVFAIFGGACSVNVRPPLFQFRVAFRSHNLSLLCDLCDLLFKIRLCDL